MNAVYDMRADEDIGRAAGQIGVKPARALPSDLEPVAPLPMAAMPEAFRDWIADVSERMQCPPDYVAVPLLVAASSLVAGKVAVRPQGETDWEEKPNLWAVIVGRPGTMKSPSMGAALAPLQRLEAKAAERHAENMVDFAASAHASKLLAEVNEKTARDKLKNNPNADVTELLRQADTDAPTRRRYIVNDLTYEALGATLAQNPNGVLSVRDELRGLLSSLSREENAAARSLYLQAWSGGSYTFDRIARGTLTIPDARLSVIGCIQPGPLASFIRGATQGGSMDDGLLQRFLICWPDNPSTWRNVDRPPNDVARRRVQDVFGRLDGLTTCDLHATQPTDYEGIPEGMPYLRFEAAALEQFEEWRADLEQRIRGDGTTATMEAALSKFRTHVPALALTLHVVDGGCGAVSAQATARALALADYFESHAHRAYSSGLRPVVGAAKAILTKIRSGALNSEAGFTLREVYRPGWEGLPDREVSESGLGLLVEHGYLSECEVRGDGRPTYIYQRISGAWQ
jgi:putative DNA primase/helicase